MPSTKPQTSTIAAPSPKERVAALKGRAAQVIPPASSAPAAGEPRHDPVHALIAASRAAEVEMAAYGRRMRGKRASEADFAEEERLSDLQNSARDAAFAATPTTRVGQLAMLDYVRFQMGLFGYADGEAPDGNGWLWVTTRQALERALAADVDLSPREMPDLSGCTINQLMNLHGAASAIAYLASAETQAPWCSNERGDDFSAAGDILDAEVRRWDHLQDAIVAELRGRTPLNETAREQRLRAIVRHGLSCGDRFLDAATLAEVAQTWGAPARG